MKRRSCSPTRVNHAGGGATPPPPFDSGEFEFVNNFSNPVQATQLIHSQTSLFFYSQSSLGLGSGWTETGGAAITPDPALNLIRRGSSDSVTAGMDGVNRILASTNLIWSAAGAHSWFVDEDPVTGAQVCVDCNNASSINGLSIVISPGGLFVGGATNARPTAADEGVVLNSAPWGESNNSATWLSYQRAKAGTSRRLIQARTSWSVNLWAWEYAKAELGWTNPTVFGVYGSSQTAPAAQQLTYSAGFTTINMRGLGATGVPIDIQLLLPATHVANGALPAVAAYQVINAYSAKWPLYVIGLGTTTAANVGYLGQLQNIWCGNTNLTTAVDGRWYGANATDRDRLQIGVFVVPWDQSVPAWVAGTYIGESQIYGRTT